MRYIGDITLVGGQVKSLRVDNLAEDPGTPALGQMWFNTTTEVLKYFDGTIVQQMAVGGSLDEYVKHDGSVEMTGALVLDSDDQSAEADNVAVSKGHVDAGLALKEDVITGAATTITGDDLAIDRAVISNGDGKVAASAVTSTELGYLDGVTSAIQAQIDGKEDELGYVPVNKAGDSLNGNLNFQGDHKVTGLASPTLATDAVNKVYVDNALAGLDFQPDVHGIQEDDTFVPTLTTGQRYILTDVEELHADFGTIAGVVNDDIVQYDGTDFYVAYSVATAGPGAITWNRGNSVWVYFNTSWSEFGGLDALNAGVGITKDGNTLNIDLGAGITALPTNEVGIDIYGSGGLFLTENGTDVSETGDAQIAVRLNGSTLNRSVDGVKVSDAGITETQLATSVAGDGLSGGAGDALEVVADTGISVSATGVAFDEAYGDARYATLSGATFTGSVILDADPSGDLEAATKQYVDAVGSDLSDLENRLTQGYYAYNGTGDSQTTHVVTHNMGNQYVAVEVIDTNDQVIIPNSITFDSANQLTVVLNSAEGIRVVVTGLKIAA